MKRSLLPTVLASLMMLCTVRMTTAFASPKKHIVWPMSGAGNGRLGVRITSMTAELRKFFGAAEDRGVLVSQVDKDSPAASAGLRAGDVIIEIDGKKVDDTDDVVEAMADKDTGA